jgi:V/A-type H+-transporting ATPase subunit D
MVQEELSLAVEGYNLLDQKRNILVMELMNLINEATAFEEDANKALSVAYTALQQTIIHTGRLQTSGIALSIGVDCQLKLKSRKIMGLELPIVQTTFIDQPPYYSPIGSYSEIDTAVIAFREALRLMGRLAELKVSIMRLASEVKKTIKKVNALDKVAIPNAHIALKFIQERLEEAERDMFVLMKSVKKSLSGDSV